MLKSPSPNTSGVWVWSCPHLLYVVLGIRLANRHIYCHLLFDKLPVSVYTVYLFLNFLCLYIQSDFRTVYIMKVSFLGIVIFHEVP